jgi:hypothetical protein
MNFSAKTLARRAAVLAGVTVLAAAGSAQAAFFNFDHDSADLVNPRASFVLAAMNWGQEVGAETIRGSLTGQLTYHGVVAGCAKVVAKWRDAAGNTLSTDVTGEACSNSSAPSAPVGVSESYRNASLRGARLELLLREANGGSYCVVESRAMKAGGK